MSETAKTMPPKNAGAFASFLASFTGTDEKRNGEWDLSELADDVATISYEQALRTARASEFATRELPKDSLQAAAVQPSSNCIRSSEGRRKTATITLRLTETEQAQLHVRAEAAKLSVSAYIRSCIFEAESLRAQVKEALAQMQAAPVAAPPIRDEKPSRSWHLRFFPHWSRGERTEEQ